MKKKLPTKKGISRKEERSNENTQHESVGIRSKPDRGFAGGSMEVWENTRGDFLEVSAKRKRPRNA